MSRSRFNGLSVQKVQRKVENGISCRSSGPGTVLGQSKYSRYLLYLGGAEGYTHSSPNVVQAPNFRYFRRLCYISVLTMVPGTLKIFSQNCAAVLDACFCLHVQRTLCRVARNVPSDRVHQVNCNTVAYIHALMSLRRSVAGTITPQQHTKRRYTDSG